MIVSTGGALIVFGILIVVAVLIAYTMSTYAEYDVSQLHTFIALLAGVGTIVTIFFYLNLIQIQANQQQLASLAEISRVNDEVLNDLLESILQASESIPEFVASIRPLMRCRSEQKDEHTIQACTLKHVLSNRIFNLFQDVVLEHKYLHHDDMAYICNFLQYANSRQLYDQWKISRLNYIESAQRFGDLLFEYALPITHQTSNTYIAVARKLIDDERCRCIMPD